MIKEALKMKDINVVEPRQPVRPSRVESKNKLKEILQKMGEILQNKVV